VTAPDVDIERELFAEYRETRDRSVRNELVERHRGLAVSLALRFNGRGEPLDDLVQVAMIALLRAIKDLHLRVRPAVAELRSDLGRAPTVPELARHLGCGDEVVVAALEVGAAYRPDSIHARTGSGEGQCLEDRLAADGDPLHSFEVVQMVRTLMSRLPERERTVLHMRFYDELSQSEIARRVGLSQMHVSRILRATLERLSHHPGVTEG